MSLGDEEALALKLLQSWQEMVQMFITQLAGIIETVTVMTVDDANVYHTVNWYHWNCYSDDNKWPVPMQMFERQLIDMNETVTVICRCLSHD